MQDTLRWFPVLQRILYRLSSIVWRCVLGIDAYLLTGPIHFNFGLLWCLMPARPLTHLPPTLRKRNALFENREKIQDCKIKHKFIYVLLTGCLLYLVATYTILFVYACYFCWIMQKLLFFTCVWVFFKIFFRA